MGNREQDLAEGQSKEWEFITLLQKSNKDCVIESSNTGDWDIRMTKQDGTMVTFEVKYDRMVETTGNIAIEIEYNDKDSGVMSTKADYIIYFAKGKFYRTEAKTLMNRIREFEIVHGGDGNKSKLILITRIEFLRVFNLYA